MFYQNELDFLREVLTKRHVNTFLIEKGEWKNVQKQLSEDVLESLALFQEKLQHVLDKHLYMLTDPCERSYAILRLPDAEKETVLCIGPFLRRVISRQQLLVLAEQNGVSPQRHSRLLEYYKSLPILGETSEILVMLNTFCERIWHTPSFAVVNCIETVPLAEPPLDKTMSNIELNDGLNNKKEVEARYAFENEMIYAVTLGQAHMEDRFREVFSYEFFKKLIDGSIRDVKNYVIMMNALLRKGAEQGGVHPVYINQTSSGFAMEIERLNSPLGASDLLINMFRSYCRLVRKHALQAFPLVVQKTIMMIDADLSAEISPKQLASSQGVTLGYLSTVFKKATGQTITEYICRRRMEYAEYLLTTTSSQIQTIALHCGIMDAQYFSKLFKKVTGKTPLQYRKSPRAIHIAE